MDQQQSSSLIEWIEQREREKAAWEESEDSESEGSLPIANASICWSDGPFPMEYYHRCDRAYAAHSFRIGYKFVQGNKVCISSKGMCGCTSVKCFNSTWAAVHGMESICMVTRYQDGDMTQHGGPLGRTYCTNQQTTCSFPTTMCRLAATVISEVECIPYNDKHYNEDDLRLCFGCTIKKPFGVVSVVPDTKKVHEESGYEAPFYGYDVSTATMFLEEKMRSGLAFTVDETIQTAIIAFQHMCRQEFKAEDIWVTTMSFLGGRKEHLFPDQRKEHLAVINGGSSAVAPPK